jgi:hypothetical protein
VRQIVITNEDARASIEDVQSVRRDLADRADCSPAWRITGAVLFGAMFAVQAAPVLIAVSLSVSCFAAIAAMAIIARKRMGFFVNGYRRGSTRKVAIALLVIIEAIYISSMWFKIEQHVVWAPLVGGVIIVPVILVAMQRWQDAYRSEFGSVGDIRT